MFSQLGDPTSSLRQPEYTGENRCLPCTVVNVVIATAIAWALSQLWIPLSISVLAILLSAIYLRGYLIPYTPTITRRYFPDRLLRLFDHHNDSRIANDEVDVEEILQAANAVTVCEHGDDLCLTDSFQAAWRKRIESLIIHDVVRRDLARIVDMDSNDLEFTEHDDAFVATVDGTQIGEWISQPAFIADVAAANEFHDRLPAWNQLDVDQQSSVLTGLRLFLEECPACDGHVTFDQEETKTCCRTIDVLAATCDECGVRLLEAEQPHV